MRSLAILLLSLCLLGGCSKDSSQAQGMGVVLLVVGDSLAAGYRIDQPQTNGWVALAEKEMRTQQFLRNDQVVVNASVSGETTTGGLEKLPELLAQHQPGHVIIELGANDFLQRRSLSQAKDNLRRMVETSQQAGAQVALMAVDMPGMAGLAGGGNLDDVYEQLADEMDLEVIEYPLASLFNEPGMMLDDRLHPSGAAQLMLAQEMGPSIRDFLAR